MTKEKESGNYTPLKVEMPTQPRYLGCASIFSYLYRKSLLYSKLLHSPDINNSLNALLQQDCHTYAHSYRRVC
jgi:hypothetical protein